MLRGREKDQYRRRGAASNTTAPPAPAPPPPAPPPTLAAHLTSGISLGHTAWSFTLKRYTRPDGLYVAITSVPHQLTAHPVMLSRERRSSWGQ